MGRQAYLDKIAFGRSAFEPAPSASESANYLQLESAQSDIPLRYHEATANNYIQLYDERGKPINPRSHEYAKKLRGAQNDVLASVGVVERRPSPSDGLPGYNNHRLELLEAEDTAGHVIALTTTLTENVCTWWLGALKDKLLTFQYHDALSFGQIVASEAAFSGVSMMRAGFASRISATMGSQTVLYSTIVSRPIDQLLHATRASAKTRKFFRSMRELFKSSLRIGLEIVFYPFVYHASLQRLGLVPASPLLPSWNALIPFSAASPLLPFSLYYNASDSISDCLKAALTSPLVLLCIEHSIERWVLSWVYDAVESSVIRPDNPDLPGRDINNKDHTLTVLGLRRPSPPLVRNTIHWLFAKAGWGRPLDNANSEHQRAIQYTNEGQTIGVGGTQITNLAQLELPVVQTQDSLTAEPPEPEVTTIPISTIEELMRSTTPTSEPDDNDPRIRITSREGIVEMEVRLPPRILSSHTEIADLLENRNLWNIGSQDEVGSIRRRSHHRVTQLSLEPAQLLGSIVRAQLIGLAMLPIRMVTLRMIASHYLASHGGYVGPHRVVRSLNLNHLSLQSITVQISHIALCGALEFCIDLGLWGLQYVGITQLGKAVFGWGTL